MPHQLPRKVAVFRALKGLGDLLCAVPALRALRTALPEAKICLVGLPQAAFLREHFPRYLDELIIFPGWPGMPEREPRPGEIPPFLSQMQSRQFDLAVQMHGNGATFNPVMVLFGAKYNAGQYLPGNFCPDPARFVGYEVLAPEVRRCLRIVENLGFEAQGEQLEFPLTNQDFAELTAATEFGPDEWSRTVCIHPGASDPLRCWPVEYFAAVGDHLAGQGWRVILTGTSGETGLVEAVARRMTNPAISLAGKLSLGGLAALLKSAGLLICNDTGVSHLADALQVKSIVVFTHSDPQVWAPLDRQLHRVVVNPTQEGAIAPGESFTFLSDRMALNQVCVQANELIGQTRPRPVNILQG